MDGTKIGQKLYMLNFAYTIINDIKNCSSCYSHFTLAIGEIKESYEDLKEPMDYLMGELKQLRTICFREKTYELEYYFGADLKLALIISGLKSANSQWPCLYCLCKKDSLHLFKKCEPRKAVESLELGEKGYKNLSLLGDLIPFKRIIICTLHMRLRIFEVLLRQLIKSLVVLDQFKETGQLSDKHVNLTKWLSFLNSKCKIKADCNYRFNPSSAAGFTRDFSGGEVLKILSEIDIDERFPGLKDNQKIQSLWKEFYSIERMISKNELDSGECQSKVNQWIELFLTIYEANHAQTPYIHMFVNHLPDLIASHYSINDFNQQGFFFEYIFFF